MNTHNTRYSRGSAAVITSIIIGLVIVVGVIYGIYSSQTPTEDVMMNKTPESVMEKAEDIIVPKDEGAMMQKGGYEAYSTEKLAFADTGTVVLFFHAPWCPTCRGADADINTNLGAIPAGLLILKTDYDSQTALRQKYGITYQHTFVKVDAAGNQLAKWSGSATLADIVAKSK